MSNDVVMIIHLLFCWRRELLVS
uniref:Uncharacterized protein n=1 Tax=Lepeophtheirus salmonis TaxID=72036 RepID=A0A0K2T8A0_LEPSM